MDTEDEVVNYLKQEPNSYDGLEIGQYRVIGNGCFVIPRQYGCTIVTLFITIGPALT